MQVRSIKPGALIVITGASGAGKDAVMESFLKDPRIKRLNIKKIVSYTDRPMRPGEKEGVEHYFVSPEEMKKMEKGNKFVEPITKTGISNKATPKTEINRLMNGENLIWRIDPIRGTEVLSGHFFKKLFPKEAIILNKHTVVYFVTAPQETLEKRRQKRDQLQYNRQAYIDRQNEEEPLLKVLRGKAVQINNLDGELDEAVDSLVVSVINFYTKLQNE